MREEGEKQARSFEMELASHALVLERMVGAVENLEELARVQRESGGRLAAEVGVIAEWVREAEEAKKGGVYARETCRHVLSFQRESNGHVWIEHERPDEPGNASGVTFPSNPIVKTHYFARVWYGCQRCGARFVVDERDEGSGEVGERPVYGELREVK